MITNVTKENFDKEVMQAQGTVLVDFWAAWCGSRLVPTGRDKL